MRRLNKFSALRLRKSLGFVRYGEPRCVRRNAKASAAAGGVFHTATMESTFLSIIISQSIVGRRLPARVRSPRRPFGKRRRGAVRRACS